MNNTSQSSSDHKSRKGSRGLKTTTATWGEHKPIKRNPHNDSYEQDITINYTHKNNKINKHKLENDNYKNYIFKPSAPKDRTKLLTRRRDRKNNLNNHFVVSQLSGANGEWSNSDDVEVTQNTISQNHYERKRAKNKNYRRKTSQIRNPEDEGFETKESDEPPICRNFQRGVCRYGDLCKFKHVANLEPCRYFVEYGKCKYGENCRYIHPALETPVDLSSLEEGVLQPPKLERYAPPPSPPLEVVTDATSETESQAIDVDEDRWTGDVRDVRLYRKSITQYNVFANFLKLRNVLLITLFSLLIDYGVSFILFERSGYTPMWVTCIIFVFFTIPALIYRKFRSYQFVKNFNLETVPYHTIENTHVGLDVWEDELEKGSLPSSVEIQYDHIANSEYREYTIVRASMNLVKQIYLKRGTITPNQNSFNNLTFDLKDKSVYYIDDRALFENSIRYYLQECTLSALRQRGERVDVLSLNPRGNGQKYITV